MEIKHLTILFEDEVVVAIHKPSGLFVHRTNLDRRVTDNCLKRVREQTGSFVYPVHRLDRGTSGVLLFAKTKEAARFLAQAFEEHRVKKSYVAVVRGYLPDHGVIDHPLSEDGKPAVPAVTGYDVLDRIELNLPVGPYSTARFSLVRCFPQTGRHHQLRKHLVHIRNPIIGDSTHGDTKQNRFFREKLNLGRLMLLAESLEFPHPAKNEMVHVEAQKEEGFNFSKPPYTALLKIENPTQKPPLNC